MLAKLIHVRRIEESPSVMIVTEISNLNWMNFRETFIKGIRLDNQWFLKTRKIACSKRYYQEVYIFDHERECCDNDIHIKQ